MENLILVLLFIVLAYGTVRIVFKNTNEYKYLLLPSMMFMGSYWHLIESIPNDVSRVSLIAISYIVLISIRTLVYDDIYNKDTIEV